MKRIRAYAVEIVLVVLTLNLVVTSIVLIYTIREFNNRPRDYATSNDVAEMESNIQNRLFQDGESYSSNLEDIQNRLKDLQEAAGLQTY